jgi:CRP/FNR family cyclic AMP-dependent transcriptional regulator
MGLTRGAPPKAGASWGRPAVVAGSRAAASRGAGSVCRLLEEDPSLGERLRLPLRARAALECRARIVRVGRGRQSKGLPDAGSGGIGLLVLDGLLIRRVQMGARGGVELLGEGDLICPPVAPVLPQEHVAADWRVLTPARLAVLDAPAAHRIARYPELTEQLVGRALERAHRLALNMAIVHHARIEARLELLFTHLAARWGRVRADGIHLPLRLTHSVLADLVAAQRPSVTSALRRLAQQQRVRATGEGWLLTRGPHSLGAPAADGGLDVGGALWASAQPSEMPGLPAGTSEAGAS